MRQHQRILRIQTQGKAFKDITRQVQSVIEDSEIQMGLCHIFLRHTSASLVIQENADSSVLKDLERFFSDLVPEGGAYLHSMEGADDMPGHIRTVLTHTSEQIPISQGLLCLGIWQGIYLWEHRQRSHLRELVVHVIGN